jgi:hypothetical protein
MVHRAGLRRAVQEDHGLTSSCSAARSCPTTQARSARFARLPWASDSTGVPVAALCCTAVVLSWAGTLRDGL